jgi:pyrimidine operon attenuation protein/uracil phosphoribosyltransferase
MSDRVILDSGHLKLIIRRLALQLVENHPDADKTVLIGLQPRGILLGERIKNELTDRGFDKGYEFGMLDVTFYRDDFRRREKPLIPSATNIDFLVEGKTVILMDDVFFTGRTVRSGLDAMLAFGRPRKVELMVLIERRFRAHLPIVPTYIGHSVDTIQGEHVAVKWQQTDGIDQVILISEEHGG